MQSGFSEHFEVCPEPKNSGLGYSQLVLLAVFFPMAWCWWDSAHQGSGCAHALRTLLIALMLGQVLLRSDSSRP